MYYSHCNVVKPPASTKEWFADRLQKEHMLAGDYAKLQPGCHARHSPCFWRLDANLRLATILSKFPSKLTDKVIEDMWGGADKEAVEKLRAKWEAPCTDPYYDRRWGIGSD